MTGNRSFFCETSPVVGAHSESVDQDLVPFLEVRVGGGHHPAHQVDPAHHGELDAGVRACGHHGIFEVEVGVIHLKCRLSVWMLKNYIWPNKVLLYRLALL